jgi:SAM-dependent methyltransferase
MQPRDHWQKVYSGRAPTEVSWYRKHDPVSMKMIRKAAVPADAAIIDVGAGASTLVDDLLAAGYGNITLLDLSAAALAAAKSRLGPLSADLRWIEADVLGTALAKGAYDLWHDRAVFHFLASPDDRRAYVRQLLGALKPGGHLVMATFAEDGPSSCSGLETMRYSAQELHAELGSRFTLVAHEKDRHTTPSGVAQPFVYCLFRI